MSYSDDEMEDFVFRPEPDKPAKVETDFDGDVIMVDLEDPEELQEANEQVIVARMLSRKSQAGRQQTLTAGERIKDPACLMVIDTSFILSHQHLLQSLVESFSTYRAVIVFPWTTLLELDGISKGFDAEMAAKMDKAHAGLQDSIHNTQAKRRVVLPRLARQAIAWMHSKFSEKSPAVWGQKPEEKLDELATADDAILDCSRYFHDVGGYKTVLLSNDRNLCVKATVCEVDAVSFKAGLTAEKILESIGLQPGTPTITSPLSPVAPVFVVPASEKTSVLSPLPIQPAKAEVKPKATIQPAKTDAKPKATLPRIRTGHGPKSKDSLNLPSTVDFWKDEDTSHATSPTTPTSPDNDEKLRARLGPFLKFMEDDLFINLARVAKLYLGALGHEDEPLTSIKDIEIAVGTHAPAADLMHRAYRKRLTEASHAHQMGLWRAWCGGGSEGTKPDVWDIREWAEDISKLWKIVFGPALNEDAKRTINGHIVTLIKEVTLIFEGKK